MTQPGQGALARAHQLSLENRESLHLTGVEDVAGFDESIVVLQTTQGALTVRGEGLHMEKIDLASGELVLRGHVQELCYEEQRAQGSFLTRLFGT